MIRRRRSIIAELQIGFAWIAAIGSVVLAVFLVIDFELFQADVRANYGHIGLIHEFVDHVAFPMAVLLVPLVLAARWLIGRSLDPLADAVERIHRATGRERGFRVAVGDLPAEALPFADAVNALLARLDDAARRQESFAADVAHELKTPLSIIMLELERLKDPSAKRIMADLAAMNRLIEQLLVLAQLDAYAAAPQPLGSSDLTQSARDAIKLIAAEGGRKGVQIAFRDDGCTPIAGRPEALTAAVRNLLENAIRATPPGGLVLVVSGPGARVRVIDEGPGIAPEELARLSDRFRRGEHASAGGAGLGLSIVARIVAVHRGTMISHPDEPSIELVFRSGTIS